MHDHIGHVSQHLRSPLGAIELLFHRVHQGSGRTGRRLVTYEPVEFKE